MSVVIKPPARVPWETAGRTVFLAGSIEMDAAARWQDRLAGLLGPLDATLLNPRRDEWDASWAQTMASAPFREQVEWELEAQERAELIVMYFDPATRSPITLLELGLFARSGKLIVCCPEGFWRKGNVDVVCHRYGVPTAASLGELAEQLRARLAA